MVCSGSTASDLQGRDKRQPESLNHTRRKGSPYSVGVRNNAIITLVKVNLHGNSQKVSFKVNAHDTSNVIRVYAWDTTNPYKSYACV